MCEIQNPMVERSTVSRGFTLTELLVVIGVITLLLGLLLPGMGMVRQKAREASTLSLMGAVEQSVFMFRKDHNRLPGHFEPRLISSVEGNTQRLNEIENIVLDLTGGPVASDYAGGENDGVFEVEIGGSTHKIDVMRCGAQDGPGYLDLGQVVQQVDGEGETTYTGNKVFRPMSDEDVSRGDSAPARPIPVVHDYFGKPLMAWSRSALAGDGSGFADIATEFDEQLNGRVRRSSFYWWSNAGILGSDWQGTRSAIGVALSSGGTPGGIRKPMVRSMYAILGHSAFHTEAGPDGYVEPTVGLGEMVLQSAGADQIFLSHNGQDGSGASGDGRTGERIQAFYGGHEAMPGPNQRLMGEFDDLVHSGG
jgi:prepilin-type N-terminal cleavage/methylation domain-containing protein